MAGARKSWWRRVDWCSLYLTGYVIYIIPHVQDARDSWTLFSFGIAIVVYPGLVAQRRADRARKAREAIPPRATVERF